MKTIEELGISPAPWKQGEWIPYCEDNIIRCDYHRKNGTTSTRIVAECNAAFSSEQALAALLNCSERESPFTMESGMPVAMDMARAALEKAGGEA